MDYFYKTFKTKTPDYLSILNPNLKLRILKLSFKSFKYTANNFCVAALDCLDSSSRYPLKFVEEYYNPSYLNDWLGKLNWRRSSNSGNKVMFIAICLIYNYERFGIRKAKLALDVWFMWMDKNQNSKTGFGVLTLTEVTCKE